MPGEGRDARPLRRLRAAAQLLAGGAGGRSPAEVLEHLLAVQAQDLRSARLALRARMRPAGAGVDGALADFDAALAGGALVAGWLARGTLHLVRREDYAWLLGLTAPGRLAANRRRLAQEGVGEADAERAVELIERALAEEGPLTRAQLGERLARRSIQTEGQALPHLLMLAALRGVAVLGPLRDGGLALGLARDRLGEAPPTALAGERRRTALAELARRYLRGHGPATAADLAAWAGLPLRDARDGLSAIAPSLVELPGERASGAGALVDLAGRDEAPGPLPPRLLPSFDPYLLGWRDRGFAVAPEHARRVHPGGGMLRAVAIEDGLAVATWGARRRGERLDVTLDPFAPLARATVDALLAEAADVARFEGLELGTVSGLGEGAR